MKTLLLRIQAGMKLQLSRTSSSHGMNWLKRKMQGKSENQLHFSILKNTVIVSLFFNIKRKQEPKRTHCSNHLPFTFDHRLQAELEEAREEARIKAQEEIVVRIQEAKVRNYCFWFLPHSEKESFI